jgi:hypothetical protein
MKRSFRSAATFALATAMAAPLGGGVLAAGEEAAAESGEAAHANAAETFAQFEQAEEKFQFLDQYCVECHNFEEWAGGVAFDTMDPTFVAEEAEVWEHVLVKLRGGLMPPPGEDHPAEESIYDFVGWMEAYLDHAGSLEPTPGRVPLHRLNRKEYANAVRDLLALEFDPASLLPDDGTYDGFDNVAETLQVSPSFLDQYLTAAHTIAVRAIGNPESRAGSEFYQPGPMSNVKQTDHVPGLPLGTRGGMVVEHYFPADGTYYVNVSDMAGGVYFLGTEFEHTFIVTLDGEKVYETTVGGEEDMKQIDQVQAPAVEAINQRLRDIPIEATAGPHKVGATFIQRSFAESEAQLDSVALGSGLERLPRVLSVEVRGPFNPTGLSETPSREAIFSCYPESAAEEAACAEEILSGLARRAYRRPVNDADMAELLDFYQRGHEAGGFEEGVRTGLTRILASPSFLYRDVPAPEGVQPGEAFDLTDLQLASRLSFFLWSSVPDDELLSLAEEGRLSNDRVMQEQVQRMLADPKSETLARNFSYQWLQLSKLADVVPEPTLFPTVAEHRDLVAYDADIRADMEEEVALFADAIIRNDESVLDFLRGDYSYVNERLALLYGINSVKGEEFRRVALEDSARWGLMGKAAILTLTSYPNRTAPVLRGAYILENILGAPPAAPPPNVEAFPEIAAGQKPMTVRERLIAHRSADSSCMSCHAVMDPLGFALENFDAVGSWREIDRFAGQVIDASGELPDGTPIRGPDDLRAALLERPDQFVQTLTHKLMTFALGRPVEYHDMPTVRAIVRNSAEEDYRFSSIVAGIVNSDQFRKSMAPVAEEETIEEAALQ